MRNLSYILLCLFMASTLHAQLEILLTNPSFEDIPKSSRQPRGWYDCGFRNESPPDTHPSGDFSVSKEAYDGDTYLGLVVRSNETYESVSQKLTFPLKTGQWYSWELMLARSSFYISLDRLTNRMHNYITPAIIRIWGGNSACERGELLATTGLIINDNWLAYKLKFQPSHIWRYIIIEAYYKPFNDNLIAAYNGNILVDDLSPIRAIDAPLPTPSKPVAREVQIIRQEESDNQFAPIARHEQKDQILIENNSFEKRQRKTRRPGSWFACDEEPMIKEEIGVKTKARNGRKFLSLLAFDDGYKESLSQQISPLLEGNSYYMTVSLAKSAEYLATDPMEDERADFSKGLQFQLWAGTDMCEEMQLLIETPVVNHEDWKQYKISFIAEDNWDNITISVSHKDKNQPYKGHLLIDQLSDILKTSN